MAAPVITQRVETPFTSGDPLVPFTANVGDLVIIFLALGGSAQTITVGDSFTNWTNGSLRFHIIYKVIDGSEGGNVQVTLGTNVKAAAVAYTIQAGTFARSILPALSTIATATSVNPDATAVSPTGSAKDYRWITAFGSAGEEADDDTWVTGTPANFGNLVQVTSSTASTAATNCCLGAADYTSNATTMDAGSFTTAQGLLWWAYTVAVYPVQTGSFTVNAVIMPRFTVNAVIELYHRTGSFSADAIRRKTFAFGGIRTWTRSTQGGSAGSGVAYGNGYWVKVGSGGVLYYRASDPTGTWTSNPQGANDFRAVAYGNGYWVAVGTSGTLYYATDPTGAWTSNAQTGGLVAVAYGNGYWVTVGSNGECYVKATDPTGAWTSNPNGTTGHTALAYGDGWWVATTTGTSIYRTQDPTGTWSSESIGVSTNAVAYGGGYWLIGSSNNGETAYATVPTSWTMGETLAAGIQEIAYGGDGFWVIVAQLGEAFQQGFIPTGTWTSNPHGTQNLEAVAWGNGYWVALEETGGGFWYQSHLYDNGLNAVLAGVSSTTYTFTDKKADAVILRTQLPSLTANAVIKRPDQPGSLTASAVLKKTSSFPTPYASVVLADSPEGYWRMGEASGFIQDASGHGHHSNSYSGSPSLGEPGLIADADTSIRFDTDERFLIPDHAGFDFNDTFTVELWFRQNATGDGNAPISCSSGWFTIRFIDGIGITCRLSSNGAEFFRAAWTEDTDVHHLVITKDGSTRAGYLDGELLTNTAANATVLNPASTLSIGGLVSTHNFLGWLDEVAVYGVTLSPEQVTAHWEAGSNPVGGVTVNAIIRKTIAPTALTADAILRRTFTSSPISATVDAIIKRLDQPGSATLDAVLQATIIGVIPPASAGFTADAWVTAGAVSGDFALDAILLATIAASGATVITQDSFTDTDDTLLSDHTPDVGIGWMGTLNQTIQGNKAAFSVDYETALLSTDGVDIDTFLDVDVWMEATPELTTPLLVGRGDMTASAGKFYAAYAYDGDIRISRWDAEQETIIGQAGESTSNTGLHFQVRGSNPTVLRLRSWWPGNTTEGSTWQIDTTDNTAGYQQAGGVGLGTLGQISYYGSDGLVDNFLATTPSAGPTLDAEIVAGAVSGSFTLDAVIRRPDQPGTATADAYIINPQLIWSDDFDRVEWMSVQQRYAVVDAYEEIPGASGTFGIDDHLFALPFSHVSAVGFPVADQTEIQFDYWIGPQASWAAYGYTATYVSVHGFPATVRYNWYTEDWQASNVVFAPQENAWYTVKFRVLRATPPGGLTTFVKVWKTGTSEPSSWVLDYEDQGFGTNQTPWLHHGSSDSSATFRLDNLRIWSLEDGPRYRAFTLDAVLRTETGTQTYTYLTANAVITDQTATTGSFAADAVIHREQTGATTLDAVIKREQTGSLTADAILRQSRTGTFSANAVILSPMGAGGINTAPGLYMVESSTKTSGSTLSHTMVYDEVGDTLLVHVVVDGQGSSSASITADQAGWTRHIYSQTNNWDLLTATYTRVVTQAGQTYSWTTVPSGEATVQIAIIRGSVFGPWFKFKNSSNVATTLHGVAAITTAGPYPAGLVIAAFLKTDGTTSLTWRTSQPTYLPWTSTVWQAQTTLSGAELKSLPDDYPPSTSFPTRASMAAWADSPSAATTAVRIYTFFPDGVWFTLDALIEPIHVFGSFGVDAIIRKTQAVHTQAAGWYPAPGWTIGKLVSQLALAEGVTLPVGLLMSVEYQLNKGGSPTDNIVVELCADDGNGKPGAVLTTIATHPAASLPTWPTWVPPIHIDLEYPITVAATYYIVWRRDGSLDASNYFVIGGADEAGELHILNDGTWVEGSKDAGFRLDLLTSRFTLDAWVPGAVIDSFGLDAVLRREQPGSATLDAVLWREQIGSLTADAVLLRTASGAATADAVIKATIAGSFTAAAVVMRTATGTFVSDAVLQKTQAASLTADAIILRTQVGSATANAVIRRTQQHTLWEHHYTHNDAHFEIWGTREAAQTFLSPVEMEVDRIDLGLHIQGTPPSDLTVEIQTTSGGDPTGTVLATGTLAPGGVGTAEGLVYRVLLSGRIKLAANTTYAIVLSTTGGDAGNCWHWNFDSTVADYPNGQKLTFFAAVWTAFPTQDFLFGVLVGTPGTLDAVLTLQGVGNFNLNAVIQKTSASSLTANATILRPQVGGFTVAAVIKASVVAATTANATIGKTTTGSLTADATLYRVQTGSIAVNAWLQKTNAGSFVTDATVLATLTGSFTAAASIYGATTFIVGLDAVIRREMVGSAIADAVLQKAFASSFTAEAWKVINVASSTTLNAVLRATELGSTTVNAIILRTFNPSTTLAATLRKTQAGSTTVDAVILRLAQAGSFTTNAWLQRTVAASRAVDAVLLDTVVGGFSVAATLSAVYTASLTADAVLFKTQSSSFTADAVIRRPSSGSVSADAVVLATGAASTTADAVISLAATGAFSLDAIRSETSTEAVTADAVVFRTQVGTIDVAAWLSATFPVSAWLAGAISVDAFIQSGTSGATILSAVIKATLTGASVTDAIVIKATSSSLTADAWIQRTVVSTFALDAVRSEMRAGSLVVDAAIGQTASGSLTADAVVLATWSASSSTDAVVLATATGSTTLDAWVVSPTAGSGSFVVDAVILREQTGALAADAIILRDQAGTLTAAAWIAGTGVGAFAADAIVSGSASATITTDAVVRRSFAGTFVLDSIELKTGTLAAQVDATIRATRTVGFATDAVLLSPRTSSTTLDAEISLVFVGGSTTLDAVLTATLVGTTELDAAILATGIGAFSVGAWLTSTPTSSFSLDAQIAAVSTTLFTLDAAIGAPGFGTFLLDASISRRIVQEIEATFSAATSAATLSAQTIEGTFAARTIAATFSTVWVDHPSEGMMTLDAVIGV